MTTWRELHAQGIQRCAAAYRDGKRCRRRDFAGGFCRTHQGVRRTIERISRAGAEADRATHKKD